MWVFAKGKGDNTHSDSGWSSWTIGLKVEPSYIAITRGIEPALPLAGSYTTPRTLPRPELAISRNLSGVKAVYDRLQVEHQDTRLRIVDRMALLRLLHKGFDDESEDLGLTVVVDHPLGGLLEPGL